MSTSLTGTRDEQRWSLEIYKRQAAHKVPRRPFPAQQYDPKPIAHKAPPLIPDGKAFPGFWCWLGKSQLLWFLVEIFPAIGNAWKEARKHSHVMFPE